MNLQWLNPWRQLREARETIAVLRDRCEEYQQRAYDAERDAFGRASDHYHQRLRMEERRAEEATKRVADLAFMNNPMPLTITSEMARMLGAPAKD